MWHASVKTETAQTSELLAEEALKGCGDANAGEWRERPWSAFQIRRRLSKDEVALAGNIVMRDIRGTPEEKKRMAMLLREVPYLRQIYG